MIVARGGQTAWLGAEERLRAVDDRLAAVDERLAAVDGQRISP